MTAKYNETLVKLVADDFDDIAEGAANIIITNRGAQSEAYIFLVRTRSIEFKIVFKAQIETVRITTNARIYRTSFSVASLEAALDEALPAAGAAQNVPNKIAEYIKAASLDGKITQASRRDYWLGRLYEDFSSAIKKTLGLDADVGWAQPSNDAAGYDITLYKKPIITVKCENSDISFVTGTEHADLAQNLAEKYSRKLGRIKVLTPRRTNS